MEEAGVSLPGVVSTFASCSECTQLWVWTGKLGWCQEWGGVDHTLENLDISYFDKVKSSTPETCCKADFSNPVDKNPSQDCKFWVVDRNSAPQMMYASKALLGHHWVLVWNTTGATLMGAKPLPHQELFKHDLTPMPPVPLMLMVGEPHPHKAEQLLRVVLGDVGLHFCDPVQTIIILHPFSLPAR